MSIGPNLQKAFFALHVTEWRKQVATDVNERVQRHRDNMRAAGMRQIHIWVPDTRKKSFAIECAWQSKSIRGDAGDTDTQDWIEKTADTDGWS